MIIQEDLQKLCVSLIGRTEGNLYIAFRKDKVLGSSSRIQLITYDKFYLSYICNIFNTTKKELLSKSQKRRLVNIRAICYAYLYNSTTLTLQTIGRKFNRDHTTVLNGLSKHQNWIDTDDRDYLDLIEEFNSKIEKI